MHTRRVGTMTLGVCLLLFGILFLARIFTSIISVTMIVKLWPCIFIFLGIEVLLSYFINNQEKLKYDGTAFLLIIILSFFSLCMAFGDYAFTHLAQFQI